MCVQNWRNGVPKTERGAHAKVCESIPFLNNRLSALSKTMLQNMQFTCCLAAKTSLRASTTVVCTHLTRTKSQQQKVLPTARVNTRTTYISHQSASKRPEMDESAQEMSPNRLVEWVCIRKTPVFPHRRRQWADSRGCRQPAKHTMISWLDRVENDVFSNDHNYFDGASELSAIDKSGSNQVETWQWILFTLSKTHKNVLTSLLKTIFQRTVELGLPFF